MQKKISIFEIKKYLNKKGFIVKKKKKIETQKSGLDNLSRTFLSSLIIISIFFIAPSIAVAPNFVAEIFENTPLKLPIGVLTAETITTSFI